MVWAAGQGVCAVGGSRFMEKVDVIVSKSQDIAGKAAVDFLRAAIILEVLVVSEDINDKFGA